MMLYIINKMKMNIHDIAQFSVVKQQNSQNSIHVYSKTCLKLPLKNRQTKILMTNGSLMKVESIVECSRWSILQYF